MLASRAIGANRDSTVYRCLRCVSISMKPFMLSMLLNILAKFRLFQVLFDLIFEIRAVCLMNLAPPPVITSVITLCALICFVSCHAHVPPP